MASAQDYYPFGMLQPGGSMNVSGYRYGFNGQERSDEINENSYGAEFWEYDSRIGRRWNIDPKPTVGISEYNTFGGNPIWFSDLKGDTIGVREDFKGQTKNVEDYENAAKNVNAGVDLLKSSKAAQSTLAVFQKNANTNLNFVVIDRIGFAETQFIVDLTKDLEDKDDREDVFNSPESITQNMKINIEVKINPPNAQKLGITTETIIHEVAVHIAPYVKLIEKLRGGKLTGQAFVNEWNSLSAEGGSNNGKQQHLDFAAGLNKLFDAIFNEVLNRMDNQADKDLLKKERVIDMGNYPNK